MKTTSLLLIILFSFYSCEKSENNDKDNFEKKGVLGLEPQNIINSLNNAYDKKSEEKLISILDYWHDEIQSINTTDISNDTIRNVYEIFQVLYTPFDIGRLGDHEWGSELYKDLKYIVIQNKVYYDFNYDINNNSERDSVIDFRPEISFTGVKNLYFSLNYQIALNAFLGSEHFPFGTYGIMSPAVPSDESYKKYQFLNQHLSIIHGHWGGYWHIETHPEVHTMHFNENMQKVRLFFRVGYMFGESYLEKKNGKWELISSSINMIE